MDAQGPEVARRFTAAAGVTFPTAVDRSQGLWELYGFKVIPNGFFVDERGMVRYAKIGGFDVRDAADRQAIEHLLESPVAGGVARPPNFATVKEALREAEEAARQNPQNQDLQLTLAERLEAARQYNRSRQTFEAVLGKNPKSVRALLGLASAELDLGEREKALAALKKAWALDPDNWVIRKQIWAVEHPDQFYPAINTEWQREEIKKEDAAKQKP
jgi:tetratricopeptide (TPR) repeat protein